MRLPLVIGLVGGIAAGKSTVARCLEAHGALWLDADRMAHEVLERREVRDQLIDRWGPGVMASEGRVDRRQIAARVFGSSASAKENLHWLEQLVHPLVRQQTEKCIAEDGSRYPAVIIDAPLLIEAGLAPGCHRILLVDAPRSVQERLAAARGWSTEELQRRQAAQLPGSEKQRWATDIIVNDGDLELLKTRVASFWNSLALNPP